jgi:hypothetical protein
MQVSAPVDAQVFDPGVEVAVYEVIVRLPLSSGASQYSVTNWSPALPRTLRGAEGAVGFGATVNCQLSVIEPLRLP